MRYKQDEITLERERRAAEEAERKRAEEKELAERRERERRGDEVKAMWFDSIRDTQNAVTRTGFKRPQCNSLTGECPPSTPKRPHDPP